MQSALLSAIEGRGLALRCVAADEGAAGYPYIEIVRAGDSARFPMLAPVPAQTADADPVRLLYSALVAIQLYAACDDFLDWCAETGIDAANARALDDFRGFGDAVATLTAMLDAATYDTLMQRLATGQAIAGAAGSSG